MSDAPGGGPRRLLDDREATLRRLEALQRDLAGMIAATEGANTDDEHDPEGATIAFERAQVVTLIEQSRRHLAEVDRALGRVDDGTYGSCERCGRPIPSGRLEARPAATTCVSCASTPRR